MTRAQQHASVLLKKVYQIVNQKLDKTAAPLAEEFLSRLFSGMGSDDLANRSDSDLYGVGVGLWNALNHTSTCERHIKVYNPELSRHGWQSSHTIIEIVVPDSPFLVDSIRMALGRSGINTHLLMHQPMRLDRDDNNKVTAVHDVEHAQLGNQTVFMIEIDRQSDEKALRRLNKELNTVLDEVNVVVNDWQPMLKKLKSVADELANSSGAKDDQSLAQSTAFLSWMSDNNFTLMGYRHYSLKQVKGDLQLIPDETGSLGLYREYVTSQVVSLSSYTTAGRDLATNQVPLVLNKSNHKSRVHRPAYIDHVGVKVFDKKGKVIGEHRFIGLYASSIYNRSALEIPLINQKLAKIMVNSDLPAGSHAYKSLLNIMETYPRDELIQATEEELLNIGLGVEQIQERDLVKLFVRKDIYGRFYSCLVYTTKERYNTALRIHSQQILKEHFKSKEDVEFSTYFTEGSMARTHYLVRVENNDQEFDLSDLQTNLIEAARTWEDRLVDSLISNFGEERAIQLSNKYQTAFPRSYKENVLPGSAVADIIQFEDLDDENQLGMLFYRPQEENIDSNHVRLKLFHLNEPLHLSDILPMLENMGLRVIGETPYRLTTSDGKVYWLLDFAMTFVASKELDIEKNRDNFQQALAQIWSGSLEDDGFNRLVLAAQASGRDVALLRAYAKYMRQIGSNFSQSYIEETFASYPDISVLLLELFRRRFNPSLKRSDKTEEKIEAKLISLLDAVENLDDDRIIRRYLEMIKATLRTNFYQLNQDKQVKDYISFKMNPSAISDMPQPVPMFEIFVYSPRVEGVHLRGGKVARGGLRWSDRREDFRTEVLGLVKAQQVKNTVIVPVGAKGGFVCKRLPSPSDRDAWLEEGKECYRTFIRGLLDITDNNVKGEIVPPKQVVRRDEDDPYLVVAADKGTATFSDIANKLSEEYQFWMGDAFASGGSNGYDHKGMGITARGAWESVKRHFREIGIDCQTTDFTCVAVGDMAGDVFGNGMLLSEHTCLVAAFNHMHIIIDPTPDSASSYKERKRLFELPRSSWADYDKSLISEGGGIFLRSAKSISLTPQIQKLLNTKEKSVTPNALIKLILCSSVDLFWNGGIGTYVKASSESDSEVGDRANDAVRVNGKQLGAKIVGEGGNLGITQLGRIEIASNGGRINTDFTDNVGGVDCSDNEVNIKILLNGLVSNGDLTEKQRNKLLVDMTENVSEIVLDNAYRQGQSISISEQLGAATVKEVIRFMHALERDNLLDRNLEFLPSDEELIERQSNGQGLTRPELAVLVAYGKMVLKEWFNVEEVTEDPYLSQTLITSFPLLLQQRYVAEMHQHPLKQEIVATRLANKVVDDVGFNFVTRLVEETGATPAEICNCYVTACEVFGVWELYEKIEGLDNKISAQLQLKMMDNLRRIIRRATRRFLTLRDRSLGIAQQIERYQPSYLQLQKNLMDVLAAEEVKLVNDESKQLQDQQVPAEIACAMAKMNSLYSVLDLTEVAEQAEQDIVAVAKLYFNLGTNIGLHWFLDQINLQSVDNHWQALARSSFREDLDWQQRQLTVSALKWASKMESNDPLDDWLAAHEPLLDRWNHMLADFKTGNTHEFAKFSVLLRELNLLNLNCSVN
ncbi:NAD-glutamate dehydrogenase [Agarivorans sp. B2Z047]|uniref:NAD-glutamate dehydrogenase n=1 Tax=Agarivorans sp. B2Z047 TaxID=2652721 RepID=UPI00128CAD81|nr:NAD-glutamate dehydrogenase [Agarivorans sp. B2Z047]MPW28450.1 NAD-glutamate dehydrogenase [Agarivorans sp. B2Z047]UQN41014.1 NAD-glutamate dehydrogenase [Agarivorans sp. B2Z047]